MLQRNQHVAMQPNCCNATKLLQRNQTVAMQPKCCNATKLLQRNQTVAMQPKCCNATKVLQCNQNVTIQQKFFNSVTVGYDLWHDKGIYFCLLLYFQEFINEFPFVLSRDYLPAIFLCLSHGDAWYFPWYSSSLFFDWSWCPFNVQLTSSFKVDDISSESTLLDYWYIQRFILSIFCPFLLLLVYTLCIETGLLLWVAFNWFVLLPAVWVLTVSGFGYFLSPFWFNDFVKLITFYPWHVIQ